MNSNTEFSSTKEYLDAIALRHHIERTDVYALYRTIDPEDDINALLYSQEECDFAEWT